MIPFIEIVFRVEEKKEARRRRRTVHLNFHQRQIHHRVLVVFFALSLFGSFPSLHFTTRLLSFLDLKHIAVL